jgi:chemotaxis protein CheD
MAETMVRMGELSVSKTPGDVLVAVGLGSCIGLALIDPARSLAGLAHVMLPAAGNRSDQAANTRFADVAVPALIGALTRLGAAPGRLQAVLVGGARMFSFSGSSLEIGARNEQATRAELARAGIRVVATATAGTTGRTVRVYVAGGRVASKESGGTPVDLLALRVAA